MLMERLIRNPRFCRQDLDLLALSVRQMLGLVEAGMAVEARRKTASVARLVQRLFEPGLSIPDWMLREDADRSLARWVERLQRLALACNLVEAELMCGECRAAGRAARGAARLALSIVSGSAAALDLRLEFAPQVPLPAIESAHDETLPPVYPAAAMPFDPRRRDPFARMLQDLDGIAGSSDRTAWHRHCAAASRLQSGWEQC